MATEYFGTFKGPGYTPESPMGQRAAATQKLYEAIEQAGKGVTETTTTELTPEIRAYFEQLNQPYAKISPEVQGLLTQAQTQLKGLAAQDPYAGMHEAYENLARQMAGAFQSRGSQAARTQQQAALSTGLTPLEASGAGESALLENMRAYFSQLPGLRLEQAGLPAKRWQDLAGLQQMYGQLAQIGAGAEHPVDVAGAIAALTKFAPTTTTQMGGNLGSIMQALAQLATYSGPSGGGGGGAQVSPSTHDYMGPYAAAQPAAAQPATGNQPQGAQAAQGQTMTGQQILDLIRSASQTTAGTTQTVQGRGTI